jgi:hypothetical protein
MRMRLTITKMMLRRMKLKPRTLTPLMCSPIAKVYVAAGEAVATEATEGSVAGVGEAQTEARSQVKFKQVGRAERWRLAISSVSISKTDSQILSFPLSAIP